MHSFLEFSRCIASLGSMCWCTTARRICVQGVRHTCTRISDRPLGLSPPRWYYCCNDTTRVFFAKFVRTLASILALYSAAAVVVELLMSTTPALSLVSGVPVVCFLAFLRGPPPPPSISPSAYLLAFTGRLRTVLRALQRLLEARIRRSKEGTARYMQTLYEGLDSHLTVYYTEVIYFARGSAVTKCLVLNSHTSLKPSFDLL